jgi:hypothetical protein
MPEMAAHPPAGSPRTCPHALVRTLLLLLIAMTTPMADEIDPAPAVALSAAQVDAAIDNARAAVDAARGAGNLWLHTARYLAEARAQRAAGRYGDALALAERAQVEATLAQNQAKLERARYELTRMGDTLPATSRDAVRQLLRAHDGDAALRLLHDSLPH